MDIYTGLLSAKTRGPDRENEDKKVRDRVRERKRERERERERERGGSH